MVSRRHLLAATAATLSSLATGCLTQSPTTSTEVAIETIEVQNQDAEPHHVTLTIKTGDTDRAFQRSLTVEAGGSRAIANPVDARGAYTIEATLDGTTISEAVTDYATAEERCVIPVVRIDSDARLNMDVRSYDSC